MHANCLNYLVAAVHRNTVLIAELGEVAVFNMNASPYFVLLCLVVQVSSICFRCHDFGTSILSGNLTLENRTFVGYELSTLQVEHFLGCFDACIVDCRCMSINWKKDPSKQGGGHQCQLNSERKDANLTALVEKPGHSYHDIETTVSEKRSYK